MIERYISVRRQLWQQPVFDISEEPMSPTRHQVDVWKAEASSFAASLDKLPFGRRDRYDLIATRAYQAGYAAAIAAAELEDNDG